MKRRDFIQTAATAATLGLPLASLGGTRNSTADPKRKIFVFGGGRDRAILSHIIKLTGKENPRICFVPTATGDSPASIQGWNSYCEGMPMRSEVMRTFINSYTTKESFEETLMRMDAIFVGGGNTLNMMAIWKFQGIDKALRKAYDAGILMSGGSAGSLCWFESGTTDSRPKALSKVECLGWIKASHCPHYNSEESRRPVYHDLISKGELSPGYACDNQSGLYFENEQMIQCVASNPANKSYYVDLVDGKIVERELKAELIY
ncbi:MAG: peptidase E [Cytophagales bacterium]|nr:peptidase E [Cytophagales bacterium]